MNLRTIRKWPPKLALVAFAATAASTPSLTALIASIEAGDMEGARRAHGTLGEVVGFAGMEVAPPTATRTGSFFSSVIEARHFGPDDGCPIGERSAFPNRHLRALDHVSGTQCRLTEGR